MGRFKVHDDKIIIPLVNIVNRNENRPCVRDSDVLVLDLILGFSCNGLAREQFIFWPLALI